MGQPFGAGNGCWRSGRVSVGRSPSLVPVHHIESTPHNGNHVIVGTAFRRVNVVAVEAGPSIGATCSKRPVGFETGLIS